MSDTTCGMCSGTGNVDTFGFYDVPCPNCNGTGRQPDPIVAYEWTFEERRCTCSPEHRRWCIRCNGTGICKLARLRRVEPKADDLQAQGEAMTDA